jgi:hypothetical protein
MPLRVNCVFRRGHVKPDEISQYFADGVCNVIVKGVLHLCKNNGVIAPPPEAKKQHITSKPVVANE